GSRTRPSLARSRRAPARYASPAPRPDDGEEAGCDSSEVLTHCRGGWASRARGLGCGPGSWDEVSPVLPHRSPPPRSSYTALSTGGLRRPARPGHPQSIREGGFEEDLELGADLVAQVVVKVAEALAGDQDGRAQREDHVVVQSGAVLE